MQHLVRTAALFRYDEHARRVGLSPGGMLRRVGIPQRYLDESDLFFPYEQLIELLELSARESGRADFGAELGALQGLQVLGPIAYLVRSSATVADALTCLGRYFHLHCAGARVQLQVSGATAVVSYDVCLRTRHPTGQAVELAVAIGSGMLRMLAGKHWAPYECVFRHGQLAEPESYHRIFGIAPRFAGEFNGYVVDARLLELPLGSADRNLHALMMRQLEPAQQQFHDALPARVEVAIRKLLPGGDVCIESVAGQLATSARSLQRRLQLEGSSFQLLLGRVRRDIAEHYLRESMLPLTQIAQLLAYENPSIFTRAFRRWHGTTPREWRARHRRLAAHVPGLKHPVATRAAS